MESVACAAIAIRRFTSGQRSDLLKIDLLVALAVAVFEEVVEIGDDAHADHIVVQRDVPEPALLSLSLQHDRGAFVATRIAIGALPISP